MPVIDFHTHAFPDELAPRAVAHICGKSGASACLDGTVTALLQSMDRAGIERSVVASIATKPTQFRKILDWSMAVRSPRLVPFPSVHPADPEALDHVGAIHAGGFPGIKLHPYYQEFYLDEPRLTPIYEKIRECGLLLLCHTGFDIAFPRERRADPERIANVIAKVPGLKFIASHLGAWEDWAEVERRLIGKPVFLETSFSISYCGAEPARRMLMQHPADYILFGTDSPWACQAAELELVRNLHLGAELERKLLYANARRLLGG